jgi:uncharacterized protein (TIGR04255 family)
LPIKYNNDPINEALCEINFLPSGKWDDAIPTAFHEKIKSDFPDAKKQIVFGVQLDSSGNIVEQKVAPISTRLQLFRKDKKALIQIGPNTLVINDLRAYSGWEKFKPLIISSFETYRDIIKPEGIASIKLKYINQIDIEGDDIELTDYFMFYPKVPEAIAKEHGHFISKVQFSYNKHDILLLTLGTSPKTKPGKGSFILDLEYIMVEPTGIKFDELSFWCDNAHNRIKAAFESCLTDKCREILKEIK